MATLLGAAGAHADQTFQNARGAELASASKSVVLELYALEAELASARSRLASLRAEAAAVEERRQAAQAQLELVRQSLASAEEHLATRLHELYVEGEPDALAVLLGAESLEEALATLDHLGRFADQDRAVIDQVRKARGDVRAALEELAGRRAELDALVADATATEAALAASLGERRAYLERLREEARLNAAQLARAQEQAQAAEQKAEEIQTGTGPPPIAGGAPPAGPGTRMTVEATAYSLQGTTATGIPVGWGVVAVDPSVIPLGTRMTIPGYGEGIAADTGSAVRGRIIDVWMPTREQALAWGRRTITITLH